MPSFCQCIHPARLPQNTKVIGDKMLIAERHVASPANEGWRNRRLPEYEIPQQCPIAFVIASREQNASIRCVR
jgi:hypothetical protein